MKSANISWICIPIVEAPAYIEGGLMTNCSGNWRVLRVPPGPPVPMEQLNLATYRILSWLDTYSGALKMSLRETCVYSSNPCLLREWRNNLLMPVVQMRGRRGRDTVENPSSCPEAGRRSLGASTCLPLSSCHGRRRRIHIRNRHRGPAVETNYRLLLSLIYVVIMDHK